MAPILNEWGVKKLCRPMKEVDKFSKFENSFLVIDLPEGWMNKSPGQEPLIFKYSSIALTGQKTVLVARIPKVVRAFECLNFLNLTMMLS